jgi:T4-like virus Myoviridae tail sheath stabiliser
MSTFYWGITRKTIVAFGSLFTNYSIFHRDKNKQIVQKIKVPITYAPKHKFLARLYQELDIESKPFEVVLPRMSFEILSYGYDRARKLNSNQPMTAFVNGQYRSMGTGVPYNLDIALYIYSKNQEDALQLFEQIIPKFPPSVNVAVEIVPEMGLTQNIPIVLNTVEFEDNYEGDYSTHRTIVYTLRFTAQVVYYGAIDGFNEDICGISSGDGKGLIRRVVTNISDTDTNERYETITETLNPFFANQDEFYTVDETIERPIL